MEFEKDTDLLLNWSIGDNEFDYTYVPGRKVLYVSHRWMTLKSRSQTPLVVVFSEWF